MAAKPKAYLESVPRLMWNQEETARRLGISVTMLAALRNRHRLYEPDCDMPHFREEEPAGGRGRPKKHKPMWSDELLRWIAFAWSKTPQGQRRYTDSEAYAIWNERREMEEKQHLQKAGY